MKGSRLHFGHAPDPRCSICARGVTLELSKTDEQGRAVHEACYVQTTLAGFRSENLRLLSTEQPASAPLAVQAALPESVASFWKPFEFVRW